MPTGGASAWGEDTPTQPSPIKGEGFHRFGDGGVTAACLALMLLVGGAGTAYPLVEVAGLLVAIALGVWCVGWRGVRLDPLEWVLVAPSVAVPLAQILPLPPSIWAALPGHDVPSRMLAAAGLASQPMPLSLDPGATIVALLALIPALAMLVAGRGLNTEARMTVLRVLLVIAAFSAVLGAVQIVVGVGPNSPSFASSHLGQGIGLFTNRNHQAALLLIALCMLPAVRWNARGERGDTLVAAGLACLFVAGVLATTSRTALLMLPFVLVVAGWRYRRQGRWVVALLLVACLCLVLLAWWQGALPRVLERFEAASDGRFTYWRTSWSAIRDYWPLGSGLGSFPLVYPLFENRADLTPLYVNHAHQDYLELLLDAGLVGALGLVLFAGWYVRRVVAAARSLGAERIGACWAILVLLLFSAVDYPLRMLALMALFGLLCALAGPAAETGARRPGTAPALAGGMVAVLATVVALGAGWTEHQRMAGRADAAVRLYPWSHLAFGDVAAQRQLAQRNAEARAAAARALRLAPTDQRALTILSLALTEDGDAAGGRRALLAAAVLGWRDPPTQAWLFAAFGEAGRMADAAARADAQLRQGRPALIPVLRTVTADPGFAASWARLIAAGPPWRRDYMTQLGDLDRLQLAAHLGLLARLPNRDREEMAAFIARAIVLGDIGSAQSVWLASGGLADPGFTRIDADRAARGGLLGWNRTELGGLEATKEDGATTLRFDGAASGLILSQNLLLLPGSYRLSFDYRTDAQMPAEPFAWTATCVADGKRIDSAATIRPGRVTMDLIVPAAACPVQRIGLHAGGMNPGTIALSAPQISLVPGPASTAN